MTDVSRLYIILCGYEILPKTVSTRDRGARFIMSDPESRTGATFLGAWSDMDASQRNQIVSDVGRR